MNTKTKDEILTEFGCPDILPNDENVTMYYPAILSAMDEYADQFKPKEAKEYDIDFSGHVLARIKVSGNSIEVLMAIGGYGHSIDANKLLITELPTKPTE